jgi:hypothetical protein
MGVSNVSCADGAARVDHARRCGISVFGTKEAPRLFSGGALASRGLCGRGADLDAALGYSGAGVICARHNAILGEGDRRRGGFGRQGVEAARRLRRQ